MADTAALVETTLELCRISSVTGDEAEVCDHVEARLRRLPLNRGEVARHSHSVVLRPPRRPGIPLVVLAGHLDTVPPRQDRPVGLYSDAFAGGESLGPDAWLQGCGASDMKSALAVMLHLIEDFEPAALPVDIGLCFYEQEEGPYLDNYLGTLLEVEPFLTEADLVVCMEPTSNKVQMGAIGCIHATLTFEGRRAHSGRPWQGHNAVHAAAPLLTRLAAAEPLLVEFGGLTFREVSSITMVQGGGTRNIVPDRFAINLNYRFAPGKSLETAQQDVRDLVGDEAGIEFTDLSPSGRVCLDNPLMAGLLQRTGPPEPKQAWTDVARFSVLGVDAINFGPGDGAQAHQRNEGCLVQAIAESYDITAAWLQSPTVAG
jgi:succinyl-diaminopimelate desuccinylase